MISICRQAEIVFFLFEMKIIINKTELHISLMQRFHNYNGKIADYQIETEISIFGTISECE